MIKLDKVHEACKIIKNMNQKSYVPLVYMAQWYQ